MCMMMMRMQEYQGNVHDDNEDAKVMLRDAMVPRA
jgi:hypothetical protein